MKIIDQKKVFFLEKASIVSHLAKHIVYREEQVKKRDGGQERGRV